MKKYLAVLCLTFTSCQEEEISVSETAGVKDQASQFVNQIANRITTASGEEYCKHILPFLKKGGNQWTRPYLVLGSSLGGGAIVQGISGREIVFDLYNLEVAGFQYSGTGYAFGAGALGGAVGSYIGIGFARKEGVLQAWEGYFMGAGASVGLPILADYLSGTVQVFSGASLEPSGKLKADLSVVGGTVGLSFGISVPTGLPLGVNYSTPLWKNDPQITRKIYENFRSVAKVSLQQNNQVVRFDSPLRTGVTYRSRSIELAKSLFSIYPISNPKASNLAALIISIGVFRDTANAAQTQCR